MNNLQQAARLQHQTHGRVDVLEHRAAVRLAAVLEVRPQRALEDGGRHQVRLGVQL